jgi:hypothetical protein
MYKVDTSLAVAMARGLEETGDVCSTEQGALRARLVMAAQMLRDCAHDIRELRESYATLRRKQE